MQALEAEGCRTELIVCDNNSTDLTAEIARQHGARVVFEPVNQISRARNSGAAAATGDWLIFVDADSFPSPGLFIQVLKAIRSGKIVGGGSTLRYDGEVGIFARSLISIWNFGSRIVRWCAGSFIFCEASAFRAIGGFSLNLYASEEIDFSARLKKFGRSLSKKVTIIDAYPLLTSSRKIRLHSKSSILRMFLKAGLRPASFLTNRDACSFWYDGKR